MRFKFTTEELSYLLAEHLFTTGRLLGLTEEDTVETELLIEDGTVIFEIVKVD